jgi:primosomal protein N' (replication factor Y)
VEFKEQPLLFCEVILPLSLPQTYTYIIPSEWNNFVKPGVRVEVQFGKRKLYAAIVHKIHSNKPDYPAKEILSVLDESPIVTVDQLRFWEWMAQYYVCHLGDIMQAALPTYFRLDSETFYLLNPYFEGDILELPDDEYLIASALQQQEKLRLEDLRLIIQKKSVGKIVKSLLDKRVILLEEFMEDRFKPKTAVFISLHPDEKDANDRYQSLFNQLSKSPKQTDILLAYFDLSRDDSWIHRSDLLLKADASATSLQSLIDKKILVSEERIIQRVREEDLGATPPVLSEIQQKALEEINLSWQTKDVTLLQGVTSSGKTHIYAELIRNAVDEGKQVLYLLPEIALTTQLISRLEKMLGKVGVYHSKFNPAQRVEIWHKVLHNEYKVVVGARSSIFLPFNNLGLIIIDEEHDASYKQQDPAPRYHARDAAIYHGIQTGAKILLGSATPALETWINARENKYGYVKIHQRFGAYSLPKLELVNMNQMRKTKRVTGILSEPLQESIHKTIEDKGQVILFHNRRGYAPYLACSVCEWVPQCKHCDIQLTYHKFSDTLRCHYCGYSQRVPAECGECKHPGLELRGSGTERIEDDLKVLFPKARIDRMDYDTARSRHAHEKIIQQLENNETDILIGTQMVTKGLDFANVRLVGVLNADALLHYPDFRAMERAFQILQQVSGRAGRTGKGKVMIQISQPSHPLMEWLQRGDLQAFYKQELEERMQYHYPPYYRLIRISVRDRDVKVAIEASKYFVQQLVPRISAECLGPVEPSISRLQNLYLREIMLKATRNSQVLVQAKAAIKEVQQMMYQFEKFRRVRILVDVDPVN